MREILDLRIDIQITENIKKVIEKWRGVSKAKIVVYDFNRARQDGIPESYLDSFALCKGDYMSGLKLYISDSYPEASIIHEIIHPMLRAEGYCCIRPIHGYRMYPNHLVNYLELFSSHFTNQMDHLIIENRIKEYDLDFDKLLKNEFLQKEKSLSQLGTTYNLNKKEKLMYALYYTLDSFDYYFYLEPYKTKVFNLFKKVEKKGYNYSNDFFDTVSSFGYITQEKYLKSASTLLEKIRKIWFDELHRYKDDIYYDFFNFMIIRCRARAQC